MARCVEKLGIVFEHMLRAVAVVHVEIDHGNSPQPVFGARMQSPHGHIVEDAEPHRLGGFGMVARRAHGGKHIARLAAAHGIHACDHGACRAQGGVFGTGRDDRVAVDLMAAHGRNGAQHRLDEGARMHKAQSVVGGARSRHAHQPGKRRIVEGRQHRLQAARIFRMMVARIVVETRRMRDELRGQRHLP
jgi:hypothetical protein